MANEPPKYYAYLLRLWRTSSAGKPAWRASLESAHTGEQHGFATLEQLFAYLKEQMDEHSFAVPQRGTAPKQLSALEGVKRYPMPAEDKATVRTDDGVTIAYKTRGDGLRNLLFVHGWGGSSTGFFWNETLEHLDLTGLRVILVDLRGHGESDKATTGFTTERFAQDMFTVADHGGADQIVVLGYSMSGRWAQWMACMQPERVVGQILIAPVPAADIPFPDEVKDQWLQVARDQNMATFDPWVHQFTRERLRPEFLQAYFEALTTTPQFSLGATLDMCRKGGQFMDRLSAIRGATLVIGGRHDPMLPPNVLRQSIVGPIDGARLAVLDCGHEIPLEKPQETAALIEAFLAGLR